MSVAPPRVAFYVVTARTLHFLAALAIGYLPARHPESIKAEPWARLGSALVASEIQYIPWC